METKELKLTQLGRYINDVNPDIISKAIKEKNKKYQNIKQAIQLLIENFYKDSVDFQKKESWKLSKVILKNVDKELKNLLTDETIIEDFVSTLNISISDLNLADKAEQEKLKKYVLDKATKILSSSGKKRKAEGNALIQEKDLTEEKETIEKQIVSTETFKTKIRPLTAMVSTNIAVINSVSKSVSMFTLRLRGLSLKLSMIKIKNSFIDKMSKFGRGISDVGRGLKNIGQASLRFIQNIGSSIAFVFNKTIEAIGKAFRFITKMVVGLFVGLFALVKMLVSIVFGAFASLVFGLFSIALSVLKIALTAIIGVLGVLTFVTGFLIRGAFGLAKGILKTVGGLLKKVFAIPIKIIKGIFSNITTLLRSPTFMFVLGLIAGLTMRYIINPLKKNYTKIKTWIVKKYETTKKVVEGIFKDDKDESKDSDKKKDEKSLFDTIITKIENNKHFQKFNKWITPIINDIMILSSTISMWSRNFTDEAWGFLKTSAIQSGVVVFSGIIGGLIGAYFGCHWIGTAVGTMIGGLAMSFFEKEKVEKFVKAEDTYSELEKYGIKKNIGVGKDTATLFGLSSSSKKEERKRNIISSAMTSGGVRTKSESEAEEVLRGFEEKKMSSALQSMIDANENLIGLHNIMSGKMSGTIAKYDEKGNLLGGTRYNLDVKQSKKSIIKEFERVEQTQLEREGILMALNDIKKNIMDENRGDKFFVKHFNEFNFESWFSQHKNDRNLSEQASDMLYSMFAYRGFLLSIGANMTRFLRESSSLSDENDPFGYIKSMLLFAFNNNLLENINYLELFNSFNSSLKGNSSEIAKIFKIDNQTERYNKLQEYMRKMYELKIGEDTFSSKQVILELQSLMGEKFNELLTEQKLNSGYGQFPNEINAIGILNEFETHLKMVDDDATKKVIIATTIAEFLEKYGIIKDDKTDVSNLRPEIFQTILNGLVLNKEKLSQIDALANQFVNGGITDLNSKMQEIEDYEETFYQIVVDKMLEDDNKIDKSEEAKLKKLKSLFRPEQLQSIIDRLLHWKNTTNNDTFEYDRAIYILQELPERSDEQSFVNPDNPSKAG